MQNEHVSCESHETSTTTNPTSSTNATSSTSTTSSTSPTCSTCTTSSSYNRKKKDYGEEYENEYGDEYENENFEYFDPLDLMINPNLQEEFKKGVNRMSNDLKQIYEKV